MALAPDCSSRLPAPLLGSFVARFTSGARPVQPTALANDRSIHRSSNHLYSGPRSLRRSVPPIMFILCSPRPLKCSNTSALGRSIPGCSSNQLFWPARRGRRSLPLSLACSGVRQYSALGRCSFDSSGAPSTLAPQFFLCSVALLGHSVLRAARCSVTPEQSSPCPTTLGLSDAWPLASAVHAAMHAAVHAVVHAVVPAVVHDVVRAARG